MKSDSLKLFQRAICLVKIRHDAAPPPQSLKDHTLVKIVALNDCFALVPHAATLVPFSFFILPAKL